MSEMPNYIAFVQSIYFKNVLLGRVTSVNKVVYRPDGRFYSK